MVASTILEDVRPRWLTPSQRRTDATANCSATSRRPRSSSSSAAGRFQIPTGIRAGGYPQLPRVPQFPVRGLRVPEPSKGGRRVREPARLQCRPGALPDHHRPPIQAPGNVPRPDLPDLQHLEPVVRVALRLPGELRDLPLRDLQTC